MKTLPQAHPLIQVQAPASFQLSPTLVPRPSPFPEIQLNPDLVSTLTQAQAWLSLCPDTWLKPRPSPFSLPAAQAPIPALHCPRLMPRPYPFTGVFRERPIGPKSADGQAKSHFGCPLPKLM